MIEGRIERYMLVSFVLHAAFISIVFAKAKSTDVFIMPSPYLVSLVSPYERPSAAASSAPKAEASLAAAKTLPDEASSKTETKKTAETPPPPKNTYVTDRLAVIKAKKDIERIAGLRNTITVGKAGEKEAPAEAPQAGASGGDIIIQSYASKIRGQIWQEWVFPDTGGGELEAIVTIFIKKDGAIEVRKMEKDSGNLMFDRSALRALDKASPVEPPPYEMEFVVRFTP